MPGETGHPLPPVNRGVQGHRRPVVAGIQDFVQSWNERREACELMGKS